MEIKIIDSNTGKFEEKKLSASTQEYLVGRHSSCDLVLDSPNVSRMHGRLIYHQGQFHYQDLASTGGTLINNEALIPNKNYSLKTNDTIRIGSFLMVVGDLSGEEASDANPKQTTDPQGDEQWWKQGEIELLCKRVIAETEDVKTFVFANENGKLFSYQPGQFVTLSLEIDGKPVKRSYSISSTPTRPYTLEITVKRVPPPADDPNIPPGLVSNWLHDHLQPGSKIMVNGPFGKFTCADKETEKLLLVSAGSGITPMMSMSRWLLDQASDLDLIFFHSARRPEDIIFKSELELLNARHPNFKLAVAITRCAIGSSWMGYTGRLNETMLQLIAPDFKDRIVYLCGPDSFMKQVKSIFSDLNFPMENFYQESFGAPKKASTSAKPASQPSPPLSEAKKAKETTPPAVTRTSQDNQPRVVFAQSQAEFPCEEGKSILELALAEGIEINYSCASGACGTCQVKQLSGECRYLQEPSFEPDADQILTCIATPVGRVEIEA